MKLDSGPNLSNPLLAPRTSGSSLLNSKTKSLGLLSRQPNTKSLLTHAKQPKSAESAKNASTKKKTVVSKNASELKTNFGLKSSLQNPLLSGSTKQTLLLSGSGSYGSATSSLGQSSLSRLSSPLLSKLDTSRPKLSSYHQTSSHLGAKVSSPTTSSYLLGSSSSSSKSSSISKPFTTSLFQTKSAKTSAHVVEEGHRDVPSAFEIPLPDYDFHLDDRDFDSVNESDEDDSFPVMNDNEVGIEVSIVDISSKKNLFINSVSASLIGGPAFDNPRDSTRGQLIEQVDVVIQHDPEFLLKVALYTRKELNIRSTANFLLALASNRRECRPYLKKYFKNSIALPSDWASVAELYQTFHDKSINYGSLPTALRKVMVTKFPDFDKYQLAKYNKTKKTKKDTSKKKEKADEKEEEDEDDKDDEKDTDGPEEDGEEENLEAISFTLKQLIRKLHIVQPVEHVMSLLGKRYPEDMESFYQSKLPGTWETDRAGKRMKLPIPETWETQVSLKGNKATTWEELIDHKKLPFMAMLRNLRNMIQAGISPKHHSWVIRKLTDEGAVIHSKQFPFRFFSAYEVLSQMEKQLDIAAMNQDSAGGKPSRWDKRYGRGRGRGRGRGQGRGGRGGNKPGKDIEIKYDVPTLKRYRKALDVAVKIATCYNVTPIKGTTLLFCNVGPYMNTPCTSARGLGKPRTVLEIGILLGLMCKYSCEECKMIIYGTKKHQTIDLEKGSILDNMESILKLAYAMMDDYSGQSTFNSDILFEMLRDRVQIDNILVLSNGSDEGQMFGPFLSKYRRLVNPNLLFVNVDLSGAKCGVSSSSDLYTHPNDVSIAGYSDQILRFVAERGNGGQLNHVENIDKAYGLQSSSMSAVSRHGMSRQASIQPQKPLPSAGSPDVRRWRTARVFISSTFRDMHGERDLLTRFVFPELRARARARYINLYEVDLRWGVTEEQTKQNKALEICLSEVSRCDLFIGMLGERYGYVPKSYAVPDAEEFDWLTDVPAGCSVTELEIRHAALNDPDAAKDRAFFYVRDSDLVRKIPKHAVAIRKDFEAESDSASQKLSNLKDRLRTSGLEVYDGYPCEFGGVADGRAVVNKLDAFGQRVINNLWNALMKHFPEDDAFVDETSNTSALHHVFMDAHVQNFTGRKTQVKQAIDTIQGCKDGVVVITGKNGCGKTAFMASVANQFRGKKQNDTYRHQVMIHFVGAAPGSGNLLAMLSRLCHELNNMFGLRLNVPQDFKNVVSQFPEFLKGAAVQCGSYPLMIFIDGIDMMEETHQAKNMEWLPMNIPEDVIFIMSVQEGGTCQKALQRRWPTQIKLGPLDLLDKAAVVRSTLAVHRKALEETAFNNQMKLLVSKREANLPLFLSLACEELRVFGVFEKVSERLKGMAHTVSSLLQEVLQRLEGDHDKDLVATTLVLLVCARDGLLEEELHELLSLYQVFSHNKYSYRDVKAIQLTGETMMPSAVFAQLLRGIKGFLGPGVDQRGDFMLEYDLVSSESRLSLSHGEIEKAVRQRYMRGAAAELEGRAHALLAGYFYTQADPKRDYSWSGKQTRALSNLAYHLASASAYQDLASVLCSLPYIKVKCQLGLAAQLLEDYQAIGGTVSANRSVQREREKFLAKPAIQVFRSFVSRNLHILSRYPSLTWQQAANEPSESPVNQAITAMMETASNSDKDLNIFEWKNKANSEESCMMTITGFAQPVNCVAISAGDHFFASGSQDCAVKLYNMETGKELKSFLGHSDAIISCCFVGKQRLVTASLDNTLSLWDVEQGHRIGVMKGHRRQVNHCCSDARGELIASASWDCTLKIWEGKTGKIKDTIVADAKQVNCATFHPEGKLIATGCWDATIKIWDSLNKKRVAVLRGHRSSVRAVAYSPSGRHIASASLDGAVKLWSATKGTQVGSLSGHTQPINALCFSSNGQQLVTASEDQRIKVWSGNLGRKIETLGKKNLSHATATKFSPNGSQVAVGYHDGYIRLYEVSSAAELFVVRYHEARVVSLKWCALPGGKLHLLIGYDSGHVELLSETGTIIMSLMESPSNPVTSVSYSHVNRLIAVTFVDNSIYLWRLPYELKANRKSPAPKPEAIIYAKCNGTVSCSDLNQRGTKLVVASRDASIFVWSTDQDTLQSGGPYEPIVSMHGCHKDWINACVWSENEDYLVTGSNDFTLKLWDMKTQKMKYHFVGHTTAINAVSFAYGCVVSACFDGTVKVWSHKGIEITTLYGHSQRVNDCDMFVQAQSFQDSNLDFDDEDGDDEPSANWASMTATEEWKEEHQKKKLDKVSKVKMENVSVVTASDDGTVQVWKPLQGNEQVSLSGHSDRVTAVAISNKGHLISGSLDNTLKMWQPKLEAQRVLDGHDAEVTCVAYSPHGQYAVSAGRDGQVIIWSIPTGQATDMLPKRVFSVPVSEKSVNAVCFLSDNKFAVGSDEGSVTLWMISKPNDAGKAWRVKLVKTIKMSRGKSLGLTNADINTPIASLAYDVASDTLYSGHNSLSDSFIVKIRVNGEKILDVMRHVNSDWIKDMKVMGGKLLVSCTSSPEVVYLNANEPTKISIATESDDTIPADIKRQPCWVNSVDLLAGSDSPQFLMGDSWGRLIIQTPQSVFFQKKVHNRAITGVGIASSGLFCTASDDGTIKLWSKKEKLSQIGQFFCQAPVGCLATSSNTAGHTSFMCGDKLGNIYFLEWK